MSLPDNATIRERAEEGVRRPWKWAAWVQPDEVIALLDRIDELEAFRCAVGIATTALEQGDMRHHAVAAALRDALNVVDHE